MCNQQALWLSSSDSCCFTLKLPPPPPFGCTLLHCACIWVYQLLNLTISNQMAVALLCPLCSRPQWSSTWRESSTGKSESWHSYQMHILHPSTAHTPRDAYRIACLGVTEGDWRILALEALEVCPRTSTELSCGSSLIIKYHLQFLNHAPAVDQFLVCPKPCHYQGDTHSYIQSCMIVKPWKRVKGWYFDQSEALVKVAVVHTWKLMDADQSTL